MGSFSEGSLSFDFKSSTPPEVLASFAALAVPDLAVGAPALPEPFEEPWDMFCPDFRAMGDPEDDPYLAEQWRHEWGSWVSEAMGVGTSPHGRLSWNELSRWHLDCRFSWKCGPDEAGEALAWLAPFIEVTDWEHPTLVGVITFEYAPRPFLLWVSKDGTWSVEDLNPDDEWTWG